MIIEIEPHLLLKMGMPTDVIDGFQMFSVPNARSRGSCAADLSP